MLIDIQVSRDTRELLGKAVVDYAETNGGHNAFMNASDQTLFKTRAMSLLAKYNPVI